MKHVYYISGFGSDERLFRNVDFGQNEAHFIAWKKPEKKESLQQYARRMAKEIKHGNAVLAGLSFGGIMAIEIAKIIKVSKVILISSIKTRSEKPCFMRVAAALHLNDILPLKPYPFLDKFENYQLGITTPEQKKLVREYRRNLDLQYSDWAINEILHWQNEWIPQQLVHIHANDDRIFPYKYVKPDYTINSGGHLFFMNKPDVLNEILKKEI